MAGTCERNNELISCFHRAFKVNHFHLPANALNCIKLRRLKSTCINILKDNKKNSDMFRILWDPSSGSIKCASLKLLVMFCVRSRCLAA